MKPLPTTYNGTTFRSRTEARWAVFFTSMSWEWTYENQGYELETGGHYLPDFEICLPNAEMYFVEVKPDDFDKFDQEEYMDRLQRFTSEAGKDLLILDGNPSCKPFDLVCHSFKGRSLGCAFLQDYEPYVRWIDEYWMNYVQIEPTTGRQFTIHRNDEHLQRKSFGRKYVESLKAAVSIQGSG
jgi:hypothetical protein